MLLISLTSCDYKNYHKLFIYLPVLKGQVRLKVQTSATAETLNQDVLNSNLFLLVKSNFKEGDTLDETAK